MSVMRQKGMATLISRLVRDYEYLVATLGLRTSVDLIIYQVTFEDLKEEPLFLRSDLTSEFPFPGYTRGVIAIPIEGHAVDSESSLADVSPPLVGESDWNREREEAWPQWRLELWHEVCHQYQDEVVGGWNKGDGSFGHTQGWEEAVDSVAAKVGCNCDVFFELMRSSDVPPRAALDSNSR